MEERREEYCDFCRPGLIEPGNLICGVKTGEAVPWHCTREAGHSGPHVACAGEAGHDLVRWEAPDGDDPTG